MAKIRIRKASPNDLKSVANVILKAFVREINENIKELESENIINYQKFYKYYLGMAHLGTPFVIYIAEVNDEIIGAAAGSVSEHHWGNDKWGSEHFWYVKKKHRGSRAGLLLFKRLISWFKQNKAKRIQMTHYTWNPKVEHFYRNKGFKPFEVSYVYKVGE